MLYTISLAYASGYDWSHDCETNKPENFMKMGKIDTPGTGSFFGPFRPSRRFVREGRKMCLSPYGQGDSPIFAANQAISWRWRLVAAKIGTVPVNGYS